MSLEQLKTEDLLHRLPGVSGMLKINAPLAKYTWFRCGGAAQIFFQPSSIDDLKQFMNRKPADIKVTLMGAASNLLVRDGGVPGVTIKLGKAAAEIIVKGRRIIAGAGANNVKVARAARDAGISGLEYLVGIPGSIGGSLRMNAGAYGYEISDALVSAQVIDDTGNEKKIYAKNLDFSYRHCALAQNWFFISAELEGTNDEIEIIQKRMDDIQTLRELTQPIRLRTGGSTFLNPGKTSAWKLIDDAGCRGLRNGDAMISPQHCNFMINIGCASANELESLGEDVRRRVKKHSGVDLEWEIMRIGYPSVSA